MPTLANDAKPGRPLPIRDTTLVSTYTNLRHQFNSSDSLVQCVECLLSSLLRILGGAIEIKRVRLGHPDQTAAPSLPSPATHPWTAHCLLYFLLIAPRSIQRRSTSHVSHVGGRPGDKDKGALLPPSVVSHHVDPRIGKTNKLTRSNLLPTAPPDLQDQRKRQMLRLRRTIASMGSWNTFPPFTQRRSTPPRDPEVPAAEQRANDG